MGSSEHKDQHKDHKAPKEHKYSSVTGKDTIYIDVDDEITTIIDKLRGSPQKIVALVLPKRATVLQSIVNMKLLKRTADDANKQVVLITSEATLLPLAGSVGMYVAKSLQSKPEVPLMPATGAPIDTGEDEPVLMDDQAAEPPLDSSKPVGELAGSNRPLTEVDDTIDLDNGAPPPGKASKLAQKVGGKGKLKVPDFNKFRMTLFLGCAGIVVLIVAWILCFSVLPKATISVETDASEIESNLNVTLTPGATALDEKSGIVPTQLQQVQKQSSQQVPATGQKDEGTKATGNIVFVNCSLSDLIAGNDRTIPAGTGVSTNGLTFITQESVTVQPSNFNPDNTCKSNKKSSAVGIVAQVAGDKYNVGSSNFSVANFPSVSGQSSGTSGGTSNIVKVVAQADIDNAKQKIVAQDVAAIKQELQLALQNLGLYPVESTFKASDPAVTTSAKVGDKAETVTVSATVTYSMFGLKKEDIQKLIATDVNKKIDTDKQVILENDAAKATYTVQNLDGGKAVLAVHATSVAGPDLKVTELRKQVAGKKSKTAQATIKANPGVTDVTVSYSPFWVTSIPDDPGKVTIVIEKPTHNDR